MRITFLINAMGRGGAEIQVRDLALRLAARGHAVQVLVLLPFEEFEAELRAAGVETTTLEMRKGTLSAASLMRLVGALRAFRPDVVHAHMFAAIMMSRVARLAQGLLRPIDGLPPVVLGTAHTPFEASSRRYLAYRVSDRWSDQWTCVCSEGIETHAKAGAVDRDRAWLTINGIDTEGFRPDTARRARARAALGLGEDLTLLAVGSFRDEQKDYGTLVDAVARLGPRAPRVLVAGHGKLLDEKRRLAVRRGVADRVTFLGLRDDVADLMQAADAFVMSSAWEALPIVLLEAAASGLPMIVTDVGDNRKVVGDDAGFVVPAKAPVELAQKIAELAEATPERRRAMGAAARRRAVDAYDLEAVVDGWLHRYATLTGHRVAR